MQPGIHHVKLAQDSPSSRGPLSRDHALRAARSPSGVRRLRSDESWIEVSSQPSSSSLSSAAPDEVNPAALGVQFDQHGRRRRRILRASSDSPAQVAVRRSSLADGSSQEEYEESESESDRIMTSSNEHIDHQILGDPSPQSAPSSSPNQISDNDDDDDENATALGVANDPPAFTPPPNAFSHPHHGRVHATQQHVSSQETRTSYFPARRPSPTRGSSANSYPSRIPRTSHSPYDMISSSHQPDHDAALRASLSTLLSCAAAARGLPKQDSYPSGQPRSYHANTTPPNRIEPSALRLVPESALPSASAPPAPTNVQQEAPEQQSPRPPQLPPRSRSPSDKPKRKASPSAKDRVSSGSKKKPRTNSPKPRQTQNASPAGNELVHPTFTTWVVSAGVVILFSAISFSAGYTMGREVGRFEAGGIVKEEGLVCGREVGKGLRRLRWGSGAGGLSVIRT